ncbi:MAG: PEGA domain-containing protein [Kiritimatiellales bacterium]|nr:PEGA domain-containing protein [Kiritimatiellota bacterium]MBL7012374.1 PEGA domain-containing protein [Kiritimatiellales bacterium]
MTTNKSFSRLAGLLLTLALVSTTCGWIPFTAPVTIHSTPEGAAVYKAGGEEPIGVTPFKTRVFHTDKIFEIRMDKFYNEPVILNFDSPENVYLKMRPEPVLVYTKPVADVYPAGSDTSLGKGSVEVNVLHEDRDYIIKAADYYDKEITIGLATDNPVVVELEHRPLITLSAVQDDVDIYEDDAFLAKAPIKEEILEPRSFEFRKEGYYKKSVDLTSAKTHELSYAMTVDLVPLPIITIDATPADAEIYLVGDEKPLGTGSLKVTIEETTSFEVKADRYYSETFTVEATKDQFAAVELDPMPYVMIDSSPSGASVSVDGTVIGTTPIEQLIEEPVSVELTKEGYLPKTVTLDGSNLSPVVTLEEVPAPPVVTKAAPPAGKESVVEESEESGMNLPLIGGAIAVLIAVLIAALIIKKKKSA